MNKKLLNGAASLSLICMAVNAWAHALEPKRLIEKLEIVGNRIYVTPDPSLKKFHKKNQTFFVEYEEGLGLENLNFSVLSIPFILCAIPFIWASGEHFVIAECDEDLFYTLERVQHVFKLFFPGNRWSGKLVPEKLVRNSPRQTADWQKIAVLFSGGLDSVCTSFYHHDEQQLLITFCGNDIALHDINAWQDVQKKAQSYATTYGHSNAFARSNCCSFFKLNYLRRVCKSILRSWSGALSSLYIAGVSSPILYLKERCSLRIASSSDITCPYALGSHPLLDNNIAFAGISVVHEQTRVNRVHKLAAVTQIAEKQKMPLPVLRVCFEQHGSGKNCCHCEKCLRTMNCILAVKPEYLHKFGFPVNVKKVVKRTKRYFAQTKHEKYNVMLQWQEIQQYLHTSRASSHVASKTLKNYFKWFKKYHFDQHVKDKKKILATRPFFEKLWQLGEQGPTPLDQLLTIQPPAARGNLL